MMKMYRMMFLVALKVHLKVGDASAFIEKYSYFIPSKLGYVVFFAMYC